MTDWVGKLPDNVIRDMPAIAPMLDLLGYDPRANPPKYGQPDHGVAENTLKVRKNSNYWKHREDDILQGIGIKASTDKTFPSQTQKAMT